MSQMEVVSKPGSWRKAIFLVFVTVWCATGTVLALRGSRAEGFGLLVTIFGVLVAFRTSRSWVRAVGFMVAIFGIAMYFGVVVVANL